MAHYAEEEKMLEEMTIEELQEECEHLMKWMEEHPDDFAAAEFFGEVRDEYFHRTGELPTGYERVA